MTIVKNSININASVEKVFAYVSNPMNTPEWMVNLVEHTNIVGSGVGQHYHWKYTMIGLPFQGESTVLVYVPNERFVTESTGGLSGSFTFIFAPHESGTKLDLEVDYTIPVPVLGKLAERLVLKRNQREADMSMQNIKERLEL